MTDSISDDAIQGWAKEVIEIEQRVLSEVSDQLGDDFVRAVRLIHGVSKRGVGRAILSGVGKSGIVARKWAATLSSTGVSAFFVDATEAAHGDLGALRQDDIVLLLSTSGETDELGHLLRFARDRDMPVIAITSNENSTLARAATISLTVRASREACPLGLAPTASTTAMMALGDALAVSLMRLSGFTADDFSKVHPGGSLNRRYFRRVGDVMNKGDRMPVVTPTSNMDQVVMEMTRKALGVALVMDGDKLAGIVTDGDLRRFLQKELPVHTTLVTTVMTANPRTVNAHDLVFEAHRLMNKMKITHFPVVDEAGKVVGIVHIHDILRAQMM